MKGATKDEQTTQAEQFIDSLTFPCQVMLMREMDNIYSSHAIAVYHECRKVGYVSENNTMDLLDACSFGQLSSPLEAQVTGIAGHISLTGHVDVPDGASSEKNRARVLDSSPFHITIPFVEEDHQLELLAHMILKRNTILRISKSLSSDWGNSHRCMRFLYVTAIAVILERYSTK